MIIETNVRQTKEIEKEIIEDVKNNFKKKSYFHKKYKEKYEFSVKTMESIFEEYNLTKDDFDYRRSYTHIMSISKYQKKYDYIRQWDIEKLFKILKLYDIKYYEFADIMQMHAATLRAFISYISPIKFSKINVVVEEIPIELTEDSVTRTDDIINILCHFLELDKEEFLSVTNR